MFKHLPEIYPEIMFSSIFMRIQGFSSHNLVLHYLAETGLIGGLAVLTLMIKQYLMGFKLWKVRSNLLSSDILISLFLMTSIFLVSSFFEAGWLWGQLSYMFVFFVALVVKANELTTE
jgi:O-antigen ligase